MKTNGQARFLREVVVLVLTDTFPTLEQVAYAASAAGFPLDTGEWGIAELRAFMDSPIPDKPHGRWQALATIKDARWIQGWVPVGNK